MNLDMIRSILFSVLFLFSYSNINAQCTAAISGNVTVCEGDSGELFVSFTGTAPWDIQYTINGNTTINIAGINTNPYALTVNEPGIYELTNVSTPTCNSGTVSGTGEVITNTPPQANIVEIQCDPTGEEFTVSIEITGGDPSSYLVDPNTGVFTGNVFVSDPIPSMSNYSFLVDDANNCGPVTVDGEVNCDCSSTAGEMISSPISVCGDESATPTYDPTNEFLDPNDILQFILHAFSGPTVGTVLGTNSLPSATFDPTTMTYGTTYYLSAVVGNDDGSGNIDLTDPCLYVSAGTPITFYAGNITIDCPVDYELSCINSSIIIDCEITGGIPPFQYQWIGPNAFSSVVENPNIIQPGIYQVTVTDANGCTATQDVTVSTAQTDLSCTVTGDFELSCDNPETEITMECTGGTPPYTYTWSNGTPNPTTIIDFPGTYAVTVTDDNGCSSANLITIIETNEGCGLIKGNIVNDLNMDCTNDAGDEPMNNWMIRATGNGVFYGISDNDGYYEIDVAPGDYDVDVVMPTQGTWTPCTASNFVNIFDTNDVAEVDHLLQALIDCPLMEVDISSPFYRRCFDGKHYVNYCNKGTITAEDVSIEVMLDTDFTVNSTSLPYTSPSAGLYVFDIPNDVEIGECGTITINSTLSCDAELGETLCSEAYIYPDTLCVAPDPLWSGASLEVSSECTPTEVIFTITNVGDGNMVAPAHYIVIQDGVMVNSAPQEVELQAGDQMDIIYPANGDTYIIQVDQVAYHPGYSMPTIAMEGCGTNPLGGFSTGFVTQFPEDDANPFISIDCQETIGSFDPNDKYGYPAGYGDEHFIDLGQDLEYRIRFQNTGTDTAFTVVIQDVLSPHLDISTLQTGASSHAYELSILGRDTLVFTFNDIMLVSSNANEPASHGFVKFRVQQNTDNELGDVIENEAAIFFDFNDPVITNTTVHTLGDHYIISSAFEPQRPDIQHLIQPNPTSGEAVLSLRGQVPQGNMTARFFDVAGQTIDEQKLIAPIGKLDLSHFQTGLYFYEITMQESMVGMGKIIVK